MTPTPDQTRLTQLTGLMAEHGWDLLLLYGHTWRKDYFRCLVNFNFSGPHAVAVVDRSGEVEVIVSDPWDAETLEGATFAPDFAAAMRRYAAKSSAAIAGKEIMEARFTHPDHVSATYLIEELRRVKSEEELARIRQAAELSDRGYQHFARSAEVGMTEYELVAEVEAF